ncbi:HAD-IA family hydrolase [Roseibium sp. HPY-6]|uniref:HAD-IA family hydrolase n=1 Tax=Roseibium sp. HPY-6 TaxID=3229852 RepID=UPI00338F6425
MSKKKASFGWYLIKAKCLMLDVDGVVYSTIAGYQRPHAGFYSFAKQTTGYLPEELLVVNDKQENVDAAKAAGWKTVHWADRNATVPFTAAVSA